MAESILKAFRERISVPGVKWVLRQGLNGYYLAIEGLGRLWAYGWRAIAHAHPPTLDPSAIQRIVVFRTDRIGDVVLVTPTLAALRRRYPHSRLVCVTASYTTQLLQGNPHLDEVLVYDPGKGAHARCAMAERLRSARFDVALVLDPFFESAWLTWRAGIPRRIGFASHGSGGLLTHRADPRWRYRHEAQSLLSIVGLLDCLQDAEPPRLWLSQEARHAAEAFWKTHGLDTTPVVGIHPGAYWSHHRWPAESFAGLADRLIGRGVPVVLFGGPSDAVVVQQVVDAMTRKPVTAPVLPLQPLAAFLARCRVFVGNNSGPMHVAAAVGTRVVALFGRWAFFDSHHKWGPSGEGHEVVLPLQGSSIQAIGVEQVAQAVDLQLDSA